MIESVIENDYISEKKVIDLIAEYEANYKGLKNNLKVPSGDEFGFGFIYNNGTEISVAQKNKSTDIYARTIPAQYIDREANINYGFILIRVW